MPVPGESHSAEERLKSTVRGTTTVNRKFMLVSRRQVLVGASADRLRRDISQVWP